MGMKSWMLVLGCCLLGGSVAAQTADDAAHTLRDAMVKKQFYLRGFSAERDMRWRWNGTALVEEAPKVHTLGVMIPASVKVRGNTVEIRGTRGTILRESDTKLGLSVSDKDVRIIVDLKGADVSTVIAQLPNLLFYPSLDAALADVPKRLQNELPSRRDGECCKPISPPVPKSCDCSDLSAECSRQGEPAGTAGAHPPSLKSSPEPEFTEEARLAKYSGNVQVNVEIDSLGRPNDLWITRPAGMGLNEQAAKAVSRYVFNAATCHGAPVVVSLYIDVNFQIF